MTTRSSSGLARLGLLGVLALGGCGLFSSGSDAGNGGDGGGSGGDGAAGMVDLNGSFVAVDWRLLNHNKSGVPQNNFDIPCDDPTVKATQLSFTVANGANQKTTTMSPCGAGTAAGEAVVGIPDATGPFTVRGAVTGLADSNSEIIKDVTPASRVTVRIYAFGCDTGSCL